jgi:hypothetical protein
MNLLKRLLVLMLKSKEYSTYAASSILREGYQDFFLNKKTSFKEKLWTQRRGFLSDKIAFYGLTEENYRNYLSDFDYWKLHPINGGFSHWIDDKLTTKLILHPFSEYLPEYYYHLVNKEIFKLMDCPGNFGNDMSDIISLLKEKKFLAAKLIGGIGGKGFVKLAFENGSFFINDNLVPEEQTIQLINELLKSKTGYLLTEYVKTHPALAKFWSYSANSLRIKIFRESHKKPVIFRPVVRFGTTRSGLVDNTASGGIFCEIDPTSGLFKGGVIFTGNKPEKLVHHPDTLLELEGQIPFWHQVLGTMFEICDYLPQLIYMGFDIVVTESGYKIIEINSLPTIEFGQCEEPILKDEKTSIFFTGLLANKSK